MSLQLPGKKVLHLLRGYWRVRLVELHTILHYSVCPKQRSFADSDLRSNYNYILSIQSIQSIQYTFERQIDVIELILCRNSLVPKYHDNRDQQISVQSLAHVLTQRVLDPVSIQQSLLGRRVTRTAASIAQTRQVIQTSKRVSIASVPTHSVTMQGSTVFLRLISTVRYSHDSLPEYLIVMVQWIKSGLISGFETTRPENKILRRIKLLRDVLTDYQLASSVPEWV